MLKQQNFPLDQATLQKLQQILSLNQEAKRIVLQFPKKYLMQSFELTQQLKKNDLKKQFYTLFDSMKHPCCTDILGAQHVDYDVLIHFGQACFSQQIKDNYYYIFPNIKNMQKDKLTETLNSKLFGNFLIQNKIGYIISQQNIYCTIQNIATQNQYIRENVQLMRLKYQKSQTDKYFGFGYYFSNKIQNSNILVIVQQQTSKLLQNIHLIFSSIQKKNIFKNNPNLYSLNLSNMELKESQAISLKPLMLRLSVISEIQKYEAFGLLVSNANTQFCKRAVQRCKQLLKIHKKKYFIFMMNNLNQVKLGNFPQIQVYVCISCYNNSLFSQRDFCRLVVAPIDLQACFNQLSIERYNFDLNVLIQNQINKQQLIVEQTINENNTALSILQKQELILANTLQTLDYYRQKQYKGLDFSQKKQVEKAKKGKIGLAQSYKPLQ